MRAGFFLHSKQIQSKSWVGFSVNFKSSPPPSSLKNSSWTFTYGTHPLNKWKKKKVKIWESKSHSPNIYTAEPWVHVLAASGAPSLPSPGVCFYPSRGPFRVNWSPCRSRLHLCLLYYWLWLCNCTNIATTLSNNPSFSLLPPDNSLRNRNSGFESADLGQRLGSKFLKSSLGNWDAHMNWLKRRIYFRNAKKFSHLVIGLSW